MFGNKKIEFSMNKEYLVEKHPDQDFKKGTKISVQKNQELICVYSDGLTESRKNEFDIKLREHVKYLFYAKSNKLVHESNWGTKARVEINYEGEKQTVGGYGSLEFRLINPVRYIEKRMSTQDFLTPDMLKTLVLSKIPEALAKVVHELEPKHKKDLNTLTLSVKEALTKEMQHSLNDYGIELVDLIVTSLNVQKVEG